MHEILDDFLIDSLDEDDVIHAIMCNVFLKIPNTNVTLCGKIIDATQPVALSEEIPPNPCPECLIKFRSIYGISPT